MEKIYYAKNNYRRAEMSISTSDNITRYEEEHFIITQGLIYQENIVIIHVYIHIKIYAFRLRIHETKTNRMERTANSALIEDLNIINQLNPYKLYIEHSIPWMVTGIYNCIQGNLN